MRIIISYQNGVSLWFQFSADGMESLGGDVELIIEDCDRLTVNEGKVFTCMAVQRPCRVAGLNI